MPFVNYYHNAKIIMIILTNIINVIRALYFFALGNYYYLIDDKPNMVKNYLKASEYGDGYAMTNVGLYYLEQEDIVNAKKYYKKAVKLDFKEAMCGLGYCYYKMEKYDKMKKCYSRGIELGCAHSLCNSADYLFNVEKDYANAIIQFTKALRITKINYAMIMYALGKCHHKLGNLEQMKKCLLIAIGIGHDDAMNYMGAYCHTIKDYDNAIKYYLMAIKTNDTNAAAKHNLNLCLGDKGDMEDLMKYREYLNRENVYKAYCHAASRYQNLELE